MQIRLSLRWSPMLYVPKSDVLTKFGNALRNHKVYQGGESHDFRGLKNGGFLSKSVDSGKAFFDISVNTNQIGVGFKADSSKNDSNMFILASFGLRSV